MAHFAELDANNEVIRIININNNDILDDTGNEDEVKGVALCRQLTGSENDWKQTSYNTSLNQHSSGGIPFRKNFAAIGHVYDVDRDAFIAPQHYLKWILNEETCSWEAPVPLPEEIDAEGNPVIYTWDEDIVNWVEVANQWN